MLAEHLLGFIRRCSRGHAHDKLDFKHVLAQPARTLFCTPAAAGTHAADDVTKGTAQQFIFVEGHARRSFWDALSGWERDEPRPVRASRDAGTVPALAADAPSDDWTAELGRYGVSASGQAEGSGLLVLRM